MKIVSRVLLILATVLPAFATGPAWDSSGDSQLTGTYYFRQVIYSASSRGSASGFYAYYGNIVFSGTGTYNITAGTFIEDTSNGFQSNPSATGSGTYSLSASGFGFISSQLVTGQNIQILVSNKIIIGSETESGYNDMFIAAPSSGLTNSSFNGTYSVSAFVPGVSPANTISGSYQLTPNGAGSLGNVSISGTTGAGSAVSQNSSSVKYSFSNGANVVTYPTNSNALFYSGQEYMYLSSDSNFVFGGSPTGFDMFVGVRNGSGTTPFSGLFYEAGFDSSESAGLDSYYGSFNAFSGSIIGHERLLYAGFAPEGFTYYNSYPTTISGTYTDSTNTVNYAVGMDGIRVGAGTNGYPSLEVALPYTPPGPTGAVYIDPTGIVNTASSAPYTAGVSPGDFITFYNGVNLANSTVFAPPGAFPTTLGGVTVLIDGLQAPIYYVSSTQVSVLVPYAASTFPIASIQINNNGVLSNTATVYVNVTTPGVFTSDPVGGDGIAAMLDFPASGGYFVVGANNPANPGDPVALYLTGLGAPFPALGTDGALGPGSGDILDQTINVDVSGVSVGTPAYAGLAPALAGLYQLNFTIPALCTASGQTGCVTAGTNTIGISGPDSYSDEAIIPISSGATAAAQTSNASPDATPARTTSAVRKTLPRLSRSGNR